MAEPSTKRPEGCPVTKPLPERIDASPEENAQAVLKMPPKKRWRYLEDGNAMVECPAE